MELDTQQAMVIGGSGMVGRQIPYGIKPTHAELDITNENSLARALNVHKPSAILLIAALVDMARAEREPELAERINVQGAARVADAAARADIPLLYLSTCAVFDGEKNTPYVESDTPHALSVYGDTKYRGEQEVLTRAPRALVVRTGWLFGGFEHDKKFIRRFYSLLSKAEPVRATNDRFGSPTYVPDLVVRMTDLLGSGKRGIVHVVNDGVSSYFEVAQTMRGMLGSESEVSGAPASDLDPKGVARGRMEGLASERGVTLRSYQEALQEYITALKERGIQ